MEGINNETHNGSFTNNVAHLHNTELDTAEEDRSSSLSDYEGSFDEQGRPDDAGQTSPSPVEENDSEAETDRLDITPQKGWNGTEVRADTGRTPSKLQLHISNYNISDRDPSPMIQRRDSAPSRNTSRKSVLNEYSCLVLTQSSATR